MIRYVVRRIFWAGVLFLVVTILTFVVFYVIPGDPARVFAGRAADQDTVERVRYALGLDQPVYVQYLRSLRRLVVDHSLGVSFGNRQSVNSAITDAAPVTLSLILGGIVLWTLLAFPIGILSALWPRTIGDRLAMTFVFLGVSVHPVWLGLILSYVFGYKLGWTPLNSYCTFVYDSSTAVCGGPVPWFQHLILPWITFAVLHAALYARMIRASVIETMHEDFVRTARAKGVPGMRLVRKHVLRYAMLPIVTMIGMDIGVAISGAVFVETVFGLGGLGQLAVGGALGRDLPVTYGVLVLTATIVIVVNLAVDLLYAVIDPRVRLVESASPSPRAVA